MDSIALLDSKKREELFLETERRNPRKLVAPIIEKDFWVCWVLHFLFTTSNYSHDLMFKGGTSLSKVYNVIDRFSEDIDLILNWEVLGYTNDELWKKRSKTQQDKFNKRVNATAATFIVHSLLPHLQDAFEKTNIDNLTIKKEDDFTLTIAYPKCFKHHYIRPEIRLEIGPLASWTPNVIKKIHPYVAETFPEQLKNGLSMVHVIKAERTFWEKVTILHQEAHRSVDGVLPARYSRHYYDVYQLYTSDIGKKALHDIQLLKEVATFKDTFYPCAWARYDLAKAGIIKLLPDENGQNKLKQDYKNMQDMIYAEVPSFDNILHSITSLEEEINNVDRVDSK